MNFLKELHAMNRDHIFSGQIFFRNKGTTFKMDRSDRKLFIALGLIAVPHHVNLESENVYATAGLQSEDGIVWGIDYKGVDVSEYSIGNSMGGILKTPIWRI